MISLNHKLFVLIFYGLTNLVLINSRKRTENSVFATIGNEATELTSLGRMARIGDLYDGTSDNFLGLSLFLESIPSHLLDEMDAPFTDYEYVFSETYSEKCKKMEVKGDLKLSLWAKLFSVKGSGLYFTEKKKDQRTVMSSLIYSETTKFETINIFSRNVSDLLDTRMMNVEKATHVVTGITWGGKVVLSVEDTNIDQRNHKDVEFGLKASLEFISKGAAASVGTENKDSDDQTEKNLKYHLYGDVSLNDGTAPQNSTDAMDFMRKIPAMIKENNDGKGKPVKYLLLPMRVIRELLDPGSENSVMLRRIQNDLVNHFVHAFDRIEKVREIATDLKESVDKYKCCITADGYDSVIDLVKKFSASRKQFRDQFTSLLVEVRSGIEDESELTKLMEDYENSEYSYIDVENKIKTNYEHLKEKMALIKLLLEYDLTFLQQGETIIMKLIGNFKFDFYVIYFHHKDGELSDGPYLDDKMRKILHFLKNNKSNAKFLVVDSKLTPDSNPYNETKISYYKDGEYVYDIDLTEPKPIRDYFLVIGRGQSQYFDPETKIWSPIDLGHPNLRHSAIVFVNNMIYLIGGIKDKEILDTILCAPVIMLPGVPKWVVCGRIGVARYKLGAIAVDNKIYIVGGENKEEVFSNVEVFDILKNKTSSITKTLYPISHVSLTTTSKQTSIYATGYPGHQMMYHIADKTWYNFGTFKTKNVITILSNMPCIISRKPRDSFKCFERNWNSMPSLNVGRELAAVVKYNDRIYAIGGRIKKSIWTHDVEYYNNESQNWKFTTPLISNITNPVAVVVSF